MGENYFTPDANQRRLIPLLSVGVLRVVVGRMEGPPKKGKPALGRRRNHEARSHHPEPREAIMRKRSFSRIILLGLAMLVLTAPASYAALYEAQQDYSWWTSDTLNLGQYDAGSLMATHGSGPVAAVISFKYLQYMYPEVYGTHLVTDPWNAALTLASEPYMNTGWSGTWVRDCLWGQQLYIEDRLAQRTVYLGQAVSQGLYSESNLGGWTPTRYQPSWLTEGKPTWQFIFQELLQGKNVELSLRVGEGESYYVTATRIYFNDGDNNNIVGSEENALIYYIDPATGVPGSSHIWQSGNGELLETDFAPGCFITMAASEGPVPLPSTLFLVGSGALGLLGWRWTQRPRR